MPRMLCFPRVHHRSPESRYWPAQRVCSSAPRRLSLLRRWAERERPKRPGIGSVTQIGRGSLRASMTSCLTIPQGCSTRFSPRPGNHDAMPWQNWLRLPGPRATTWHMGNVFWRRSRKRGAIPLITRSVLAYRPHGLIGLITPWNYPFLLTVGDALPALLAGNAVFVKPSEWTPLSAALGRSLLVDSGLDPDLLTVVQGGAEAGTR